MRRARLALGVVSLLFVAGCGDADPSPPTPADLAEIDLSPDHTITVSADGYEPRELEVEAGEVILLVNGGDEPHSFTADDQQFDTGRMEPGDETTLVLIDPGTSTYRDIEEPDHEATLTVTEASAG